MTEAQGPEVPQELQKSRLWGGGGEGRDQPESPNGGQSWPREDTLWMVFHEVL